MQQVAQRKTQDRYRCQAWHIADQQIRIKAQPNEMQQGMTVTDNTRYSHQGAASMDSDSYWITIDSCCSYSIAKCRRDFVGEMTRCSIQFKGFNGTNHVTCKGTWRFKLEDDNGLAHKVCIRDSLY